MTSIDRAARRVWALVALIAVLLALIALPVFLNNARVNDLRDLADTQKKNLACVTDWANATAARSQRIIDLSNAKNAAADTVFRALAAVLKNLTRTTPAQVKTLASASQAYLTASNDYNNALALHPLPPSPQLACGGKPKPTPAVVIVTKTAPGGQVVITTSRPGSTTTSTQTVPQPTTVTVPGPPGAVRTVTRTRTRTVTRTVMPPSCLVTKLKPPCVIALPK